MAASIEQRNKSPARVVSPKRWLGFLDCGTVAEELPGLKEKEASEKVPRASSPEVAHDVNTEIAGAFSRLLDRRPSSATGARSRLSNDAQALHGRPSSASMQRPSTAHSVMLRRGTRAPLPSGAGVRWARPPRLGPGRGGGPRGFPLHPPRAKLVCGGIGPRPGRGTGLPSCPQCGSAGGGRMMHPRGSRPPRMPLPGRGSPPRALMGPNRHALGRGMPPRPGLGRGIPIPPRSAMFRGPRGAMQGRGRGAPGARVLMGPRGPMMGRGRGPPPPRAMGRPRGFPRLMGAAGGRGGGEGGGKEVPVAAPSWMSAALTRGDDDDFAQPVPVSKTPAALTDKPAVAIPSPEELTGKTGSAATVTATTEPRLPPWAKPSKHAESAAAPKDDHGDKADRQRRPSLGGGMPKWGPPQSASLAPVSGSRQPEEVNAPSPPPRQDGVPDWLQTTGRELNAAETVGAVQKRGGGPTHVNDNVHADGGLDWLKAAATPNIAGTSTTAVAPPAVMPHQMGTVAGSASEEKVTDVASGTAETDWLAAALRGEAPSSSRAPVGVTDIAKPVETQGVASGGDWLSAAAAGGNGGHGAAGKSLAKRRRSSVAPGGWMSVKLGLSTGDEDDQDKPVSVPSTSTPGAPKQTAPSSAASTASAGGGWLTSGTLGVPMDDDEEQPAVETAAAAARSKKTKKRDKKGRSPKKIKGAPAETSSTIPGGWLAAAVSTGVLGTPQDDDGQDESDPDSNSHVEPPKSPTKAASGNDTTPTSDAGSTPRRGLGGGRPAWAPALPEPVAAPANQESSAAVKPTQKAEEDVSSEEGLPDWLAAAAGGATKPKATATQDSNDSVLENPSEAKTSAPPILPISAEDVLAAALAGKTIVASPSSAPSASMAADSNVATPVAEKADSGQGSGDLDWLSAAAIQGKPKKKRVSVGSGAVSSGKRVSFSVDSNERKVTGGPTVGVTSTGGWLASGKLGIKTTDEDDEDRGGTANSATDGRGASSKKKKKAGSGKKGDKSKGGKFEVAAEPATPGGWLAAAISSGKLGVKDDGGSDDEGSGEDRGNGPKMASSSTQWEEGDIDEKLKVSKRELPPWAKIWTPPVPDPPTTEEDEEEKKDIAPSESKVGGLDWISGAMSGVPAEEDSQGDSGAATAIATTNTAGDDGSGELDWLTLAAAGNTPTTTNLDVSVGVTPARSPSSGVADAAVSDADGGGGGLDWLTVATTGEKVGAGGEKARRGSLKGARKFSVSATAPGGWMTSGKLGVSTEDVSDNYAAGGGKVDNTGDGGAKKGGVKESSAKKITKGKNTAGDAAGDSPAAASGAGGWLASGKLGVKIDDEESDQGDAVGRDDTVSPAMVSLETQTEDDIEGIIQRENEPKLPPWVKRWTPPVPEPEEVIPEPTPEPAEGGASAKEDSSGTPDWVTASFGGGGGGGGGGGETVAANAVPKGGDGGLDWLAQAVDPSSPAVSMVVEGTTATSDGVGADWLQQAASGGAGGLKSKTVKKGTGPSTRRPSATKSAPAAAPLSWMNTINRRSSMNLEEDAIVQATVAEAKTKTTTTVPGGWLQAGNLGAPDAIEEEKALEEARTTPSLARPAETDAGSGSNAAKSHSNSGGRRPSLAGGAPSWAPKQLKPPSSGESPPGRRPSLAGGLPPWAPANQQQEKVGGKSGSARRPSLSGGLPAWAPAPSSAVAASDDDAEQTVSESKQEEEKATSTAIPGWLAAAAGGEATTGVADCASSDARGAEDGGGLNWLTQAASENTVAGIPKPPKHSCSVANTSTAVGNAGGGGGGLDWLSAAHSGGGQVIPKPRRSSTAKPKIPSAAVAAGSWMTSGKLGVSTEDDSEEENKPNGSNGGGSGGAALGRTKGGRPPKTKGKASVPTASGPGGWLASGSLGVPVDEESDEEIEGGRNGGGAILVTMETQTEDDIEGIVKRGDVPKLPPWANRWVPPTPKVVEVVEDDVEKAEGDEKKDSTKASATPDWILASVGGGTDIDEPGAAGGTAGGGGGNGGLDWLSQAAQGDSPAAIPAGFQGGGNNGPDWLNDATRAATSKRKQAKYHAGGSASARAPLAGRKIAPAPLSWMGKMKRRSSMDLEDDVVQANIAQAKAKAVPGGWLQMGTLGAPDAVEEEKSLSEARAAATLARPTETNAGSESNDTKSHPSSTGRGRRPSLAGGAPSWAPKQLKPPSSGESPQGRRPSLAGGLPPWAQANQHEDKGTGGGKSGAARRPSLSGGLPAWAPAPSPAVGASTDDAEQAASESKEEEAEATSAVALPSWLAAAVGGLAAAAGGEATTGVADGASSATQGDKDSGGLNWLTQAASGSTVAGVPKSVKPSSSPAGMPTAVDDVDNVIGGGLDWLSAAQSGGGQARPTLRRSSTTKPTASTPTVAAGSWMTSGKLGVSTGDDSDEENKPNISKDRGSGGASVERTTRNRASKAKRKASVPTASGLGGWLASGSLGVPVDEEDDEDIEGGGNVGGAVMVTIETQTEEDIEGIVKRRDAPKLPPWAKRWVPPTPEVVKVVEIEKVEGDEKDSTKASATPDWILASVGGSTDIGGPVGAKIIAEGGSSSEGLDWLAQAAQADAAAATTPGIQDGDNGPDWLKDASKATTAQTKPTKNQAGGKVSARPYTAERKTAPAPLSWMSKMKRRSSMDLDNDAVQETATVAEAKTKTKTTAPGGWLQMGTLGAPDAVEEEKSLAEARATSSLTRPAENDSDSGTKGKSHSSSGGRRSSLAGGAPSWAPKQLKSPSSGEAPQGRRPSLAGGLPPWAPANQQQEKGEGKSGAARRPSLGGGLPAWAPAPSPTAGVSADDVEQAASASKQEEAEATSAVALPGWLAAVAGGEETPGVADGTSSDTQGDKGGGGLSWLAQAASGNTIAGDLKPAKPSCSVANVSTSVGDVGGGEGSLDWLYTALPGGGQARPTPRRSSTAKPKISTPAAAAGSWMTSGKLGVSTGDDSDEESKPNVSKDGGSGGASVERMKGSRASKAKGKASVQTASCPGGWLASGSLGVPVDEENDEEKEGGGNGGGAVMVTIETQTEDDIEGIVKRGEVSKLPPWAKRWVPPTPEVVEVLVVEKAEDEKDSTKVSATPDWILASVGGGTDIDDPVGSMIAGGGGGNGGLDWLAQATQADSTAATPGFQGGGNNDPDWLNDASNTTTTKRKQAKYQAGGNASARRPPSGRKTAPTPLSWMSKMKRRSSMDLVDDDVQASIAQAKAKAVPGGWLQLGTLGAPDAVEEEKALEEARAASSLTRAIIKYSPNGTTTGSPSSKRRSSLEGGLPLWAPHTAVSSSSQSGRRPSLAGGAPPWAPSQQKSRSEEAQAAASSTAGDDAPRGGSSLGGGLPPWASAKNTAGGGDSCAAGKSRRRRSSLEGGMPAWGPPRKTGAKESRETLSVPSKEEDRKVDETVAASAVLPDWLAAAAGEGSSGKVSAIMLDAVQEGEGSGTDDDGLNWLMQAASGSKPPMAASSTETTPTPADDDILATALSGKPIPTGVVAIPVAVESDHADSAGGEGDGLGWLSVSKSSGKQGREAQLKAPVTATRTGKTSRDAVIKSSGGFGGWLSTANVGRQLTKNGDNMQGSSVFTRNGGKPSGTVASGASALGGWLTTAADSGRLGTPGSNENLDSDEVAEGVRFGMVEVGTQTVDVTVTMSQPTPMAEKSKTKLPPWAKPWTPPPVATAAADPVASPGSPSSRILSTTAVEDSSTVDKSTSAGGLDWIKVTVGGPSNSSKEPGTTHATSVDKVNTDEHDGGLSWLKKAATAGSSPSSVANNTLDDDPFSAAISGRPIATTNTATDPRSTPVELRTSSDWLAVAVSGNTQRESNGATGKAPSRRRSGGHGGAWMTAGKLGISVGDSEYKDENDIQSTKVRPVGTDVPVKGESASENKAGSVRTVASTGPGGWLAAAATFGQLGVPGGDDMDNDGEIGSGIDESRSRGVTIETQTDDNIGKAVEEASKPRLPPWAKPWTPPVPDVEDQGPGSAGTEPSAVVVEEASPNPTTPSREGLDWITATSKGPTTDGNTPIIGDGGGLDWVAQATACTTATPSAQETDSPPTSPPDLLAAAISGKPLAAGTLKSSIVPTTSGSPGASDWITSAALGNGRNKIINARAATDAPTGQSSCKKNPTSKAPSGSWLTAGGTLGVSTREDDDEDSDTRRSVRRPTLTSSTGHSAGSGTKKRGRQCQPATSGVGGWLTAAVATGILGISGDENDGDSGEDIVEGGGLRKGGRATETATVGTQWEEDAGESACSKNRLPPWVIPYHPRSEEAAVIEDVAVAGMMEEQVTTSPAVPDWIAASMGMKPASPFAVKTPGVAEEPSTGGGGLNWLRQASTAGLEDDVATTLSDGSLAWLTHATTATTTPRKQWSSSGSNSKATSRLVSPPPLSWIKNMNKRASIDLEGVDIGPENETGLSPLPTATTSAATRKGGWLTFGTLGAPDVVQEANALRKARDSENKMAAPLPGSLSLHPTMSTLKRSRLSDGAQEKEPAPCSTEQHPNISGGALPPWAPKGKKPSLSATSSRKGSFLDGGLPSWAPGNESTKNGPREPLSQPERPSLMGSFPARVPEVGKGNEQVAAAMVSDSDVVAPLEILTGSTGSSAPSGESECPQVSEAVPGTAARLSRLADGGLPPSGPPAATVTSFEQLPSKGARADTGEVVRFGEGNEAGEGGVAGTTGTTTVGTQCGDTMTCVGVVTGQNSRDCGLQVDLDRDLDTLGTS